MSKESVLRLVLVVLCCVLPAVAGASGGGSQEFSVSPGGALLLDLEAGGSVVISGTGGSSVTVAYEISDHTAECCTVEAREVGSGVEVVSRYKSRSSRQSSDIDIVVAVPSEFDVEVDSMGGGVEIDGVEGQFSGKTMGGKLILNNVRGKARLTTMGGEIRLTNSELDGSLKTMGGEVLFENVIGDVKGSSMGGNVRYKNVQRRGGDMAAPSRTGGIEESNPDTVQISTMGGAIKVEEAPAGADVHTMGGNIRIRDAQQFVRAKTMGGDIEIESVDGWVKATTMGGDIEARVIGAGGEVELISMSGDIVLLVPPGFGMDLDLEIAFTRNSRKSYKITAPGDLPSTVTPEWSYGHGSPRKFIRMEGSVNGGGESVRIETVNGNIEVIEGR